MLWQGSDPSHMLGKTRGADFAMQRFVLALLFVTLAATAVAYLVGRFSRANNTAVERDAALTGSTMQRISFFLLLCLMVYAVMSGAS